MSLCVVAFPSLSVADAGWLQSVRAIHDPQYNEIAPHITFMFPNSLELSALEDHVRSVVPSTPAFTVVFRCALPFRGPLDTTSHLFMVPDEGFSNIVRLHDRLYSGDFAHLATGSVAFVPHMTIRVFDDHAACKDAAYDLNAMNFEIQGQVLTLSIVSGEGQAKVYREIGLTPVG